CGGCGCHDSFSPFRSLTGSAGATGPGNALIDAVGVPLGRLGLTEDVPGVVLDGLGHGDGAVEIRVDLSDVVVDPLGDIEDGGGAVVRSELAVSFVRWSWMSESVAMLIPCPVLAMFSALWLMRFAALAVRASKDTLTIPATITTATTTPFVSATAPRSSRHRR